jgi:penicillin amidase
MPPSLGPADLRAALPDLAGPLRLAGLGARVAVWRDPEGIPHVRAGSTLDAFFAQGFVHAQDRLWHMEYDRRRAYGRWAEYVGPAGVAQDRHMRRLRLGPSARVDYEAASLETRALLEAYAAGVNAFVEGTATLPIEFRILDARPEPWTPWDSLVVFKVRHVEMGPWQAKVWRARLVGHLGPERAARLCPGAPPNPVLIVPPGAVYEGPEPAGLAEFEAGAAALAAVASWEQGSNNWAVAGSRTASGKPLVAGDPHRALEVPNVYYQNHVACPEFDAIGLSFPGVPGFPHFGHNRAVAWCVTHTVADYQDLFVERFDPRDPRRYRYRDEWRLAETARETIHVRGGAPVELDVTVTHHGPILLGDPGTGPAVALRYTATAEPNRTFDALLPMLRAGSADELEAAMRTWVDPVNNFVFADVHGAIGYRTRGQVPIRAAANAWLPVPGWDGTHEWQGAIPFEAMPAIRDPGTGWIATANARVTGPEYPHYIGLDFAPDFRTRRLVERLRGLSGATVADMAAIHADRVSIPAREILETVRALGPALRVDEHATRARDLLAGWDGTMDAGSVAATVYAAFRERLMRDLMTPILGPLAAEAFAGMPRGGVAHMARLRAQLGEWIRRDDRQLLPAGTDWPAALARALAGATADLRATLGPDPAAWSWGRVHATQPQHPLSLAFPELGGRLDPPAAPIGGDADTVQAASFVPGAGFGVTGTAVARYAFDLGDWERSGWVVPLGGSGHPGSPHYADQVAPWTECRLLPMRYDWSRIRAEAESHQVLDPAGG